MVKDILQTKMLEFAKAKDTLRLGVIRYFLSQIKNKEIELRPQGIEITDAHIFKVLKKQIKQINETIETCEKANRAEALQKAKDEKVVLEEFVTLFPTEIQQL